MCHYRSWLRRHERLYRTARDRYEKPGQSLPNSPDIGAEAELYTTSDAARTFGSELDQTHLDFVALVDPAKVPLHLAAGPNMVLGLISASARTWFCDVLVRNQLHPPPDNGFSKHPEPAKSSWLEHGEHECNVGILFEVRSWTYPGSKPRITEVLIFAARPTARTNLVELAKCSVLLDEDEGQASSTRELPPQLVVMYALPLSSDLIYTPSVRVKPEDGGDEIPQPPTVEPDQTRNSRVDELFLQAAARRKKRKTSGGKSISQAAAHRLGPAALRDGFAPTLLRQETSDQSLPGRDSTRLQPTTAPHTAAAVQTRATAETSDPFADASLLNRNHKLISRIVMAGMRMRGLQQSKTATISQRATSSNSLRDQKPEGQIEGADAEYKAVYHHTYKGVVFAFVSLLFQGMIAAQLAYHLGTAGATEYESTYD